MMSQDILVNVTPGEVRVALVEEAHLQEVYIERTKRLGLLGNIYKGRVLRLLPGIQAAFIDVGLDRSAFLHISNMGYPTNTDIETVLRPGQVILVQVYKDPLAGKGARLTTQVTIPSRYIVLTPGVFQVSVSQRIADEAERERLTSMIKPIAAGGFIFRTFSEGVTQEDIDRDQEFLNVLWSDIEARSWETKPPAIVYEDIPLVLRVLRDWVGYDVKKIRIDDKVAAETMRAFADRYIPALAARIEYYAEVKPLFQLYAVEEALEKALERKVTLPSGGYLVFDQTEAMTTIDVNTGSYVGKSTIVKTNMEAVQVIARQIRLRNLGGIIIIDFIDLVDPLHKENLLQFLATALSTDSAKIQISELSSLGLVQLTRKRTRESLEHILCVSCPLCQSRGSIKSVETMCHTIYRELKRIAQDSPWTGLLVVTSPSVSTRLSQKDLERACGKPIKLKADMTYSQERYAILPYDG